MRLAPGLPVARLGLRLGPPGIPIFWSFGLYRTIYRYSGTSIFLTILSATFVYGLIYFSVIGVYSIEGVPRTIGILQPMLLFFGPP